MSLIFVFFFTGGMCLQNQLNADCCAKGILTVTLVIYPSRPLDSREHSHMTSDVQVGRQVGQAAYDFTEQTYVHSKVSDQGQVGRQEGQKYPKAFDVICEWSPRKFTLTLTQLPFLLGPRHAKANLRATVNLFLDFHSETVGVKQGPSFKNQGSQMLE